MLIESHEGVAAGADYQVNTRARTGRSATRPMSITSRSPARCRRAAYRDLMAAIGANARFNEFLPSPPAARWCATRSFVRFDGEGTLAGVRGATLLKDRQHADTTLVVDHAAAGCDSREVFKTVLDDEVARRVPGQDHRAAARAEDRRQDGDPCAAAVRRRGGRRQAGTGNLRRRRAVRPRRDLRRDLDEDLLFYLKARGIPAKEAESLLIQAFVGEAVEAHRTRRRARRADGRAARALAEEQGAMTMHPAVSNGTLRRRPHPRGFSDPGDAGLWQAADLSRQRRLGAEAAGRARPHSARLHPRIRQRASRSALSRQCRDRGLRGRARDGARRSSMPSAARRSSSPATPPRRSTWWPPPSAATASSEGDEIVLSIMEHHSNIVPWHFLRERQGAVIKWAPVDDDGNFLIDEFEKLLTPRTKMVAITQMSNVLGTLVPIKEVVRLAHARGIPVLVDGSQAAVHLDVDVQDLGCDFYVCHRPQALRPDRHRRALRQVRASRRDAAVQRRRRDDPRSAPRTASPTAIRRTGSRPARRRSCRRSGSARRSTTSNSIGKHAHPGPRGRPHALRP